jgi:heme-degrading monooxygenase HmoA
MYIPRAVYHGTGISISNLVIKHLKFEDPQSSPEIFNMAQPSTILVEIISARTHPNQKTTLTSTFQRIFDISTSAAVPNVVDPGLGLKIFPNNTASEDEAGIIVMWKDMNHHDTLGQQEGFAEGRRLFGEVVQPSVQNMEVEYVETGMVEEALGVKDGSVKAVEVLHVKVEGARDVKGGVKEVFENIKKPEGFSGYFAGQNKDESGMSVVVTKWASKVVFDDASWRKSSEEALVSALGSGAKVVKRQQLHV